MAMETPGAGVVSDDEQVDPLSGSDRDRVHLDRLCEWPSILVGHQEGVAMQMHRMALRADVDQPQPHHIAERR